MASKFHQIWLGDSAELCQRFKPGSINCVITDPPFGSDNHSNMATTPHGKEMARKIANDSTPEEALAVFEKVMDSLMPAMAPVSDIYVFTAGQVLKEWLYFTQQYFPLHGYVNKGILIWAKNSPGIGDLESWGQAIEYIMYFKRGGRPRSAGQTRQNGIFTDATLPPGKLLHPHEKPPSLLRKLIEHSTDRGDWLVDPFGGSGSLVRAAEATGRRAVAIELDPMNHRIAQDALESAEGEGFF